MRLSLALTLTLLLTGSALAEQRPNIVLIVADYMGYGDIGPYGGTEIRTPHLDNLAREGVRFTNAYAAAPICSPSRVALLTGRYPQRAGFEENVGGPGRPVGLPASETSIARMLKDSGYRTALVGKWHLGLTSEYSPNRHGFDEFFGFLDWSVDYYSHRTIGGEPGSMPTRHPSRSTGIRPICSLNARLSSSRRVGSRPFSCTLPTTPRSRRISRRAVRKTCAPRRTGFAERGRTTFRLWKRSMRASAASSTWSTKTRSSSLPTITAARSSDGARRCSTGSGRCGKAVSVSR